MHFFTETEMARRLNHERTNLDRKRKLNVVDETEFRKTDVAARWLEGAERWQERVNRRKKAVAEYKRQKAARRKRRNSGADDPPF